MTKDYVNEWLKLTFHKTTLKDGYEILGIRPCLVCNDGYKLSIQASHSHYCDPRVNNSNYYYNVELGYPNMVDDELLEYAEESDNPTKTVYGYVPVEIVNQVIEKHGGWNLSERELILKNFFEIVKNRK